MALDRHTRKAVADAARDAVRDAMAEAMEIYGEHWLTAEELVEKFGFFTKDWLKRYGCTLGRERFEVVDGEGRRHVSKWAYPEHKIQRMIAERKHKGIVVSGLEAVAAGCGGNEVEIKDKDAVTQQRT